MRQPLVQSARVALEEMIVIVVKVGGAALLSHSRAPLADLRAQRADPLEESIVLVVGDLEGDVVTGLLRQAVAFHDRDPHAADEQELLA